MAFAKGRVSLVRGEGQEKPCFSKAGVDAAAPVATTGARVFTKTKGGVLEGVGAAAAAAAAERKSRKRERTKTEVPAATPERRRRRREEASDEAPPARRQRKSELSKAEREEKRRRRERREAREARAVAKGGLEKGKKVEKKAAPEAFGSLIDRLTRNVRLAEKERRKQARREGGRQRRERTRSPPDRRAAAAPKLPPSADAGPGASPLEDELRNKLLQLQRQQLESSIGAESKAGAAAADGRREASVEDDDVSSLYFDDDSDGQEAAENPAQESSDGLSLGSDGEEEAGGEGNGGAAQTANPADDEGQQLMLETVCDKTGMTPKFAKLCLEAAEWDAALSLTLFEEQRAGLQPDSFLPPDPLGGYKARREWLSKKCGLTPHYSRMCLEVADGNAAEAVRLFEESKPTLPADAFLAGARQ